MNNQHNIVAGEAGGTVTILAGFVSGSVINLSVEKIFVIFPNGTQINIPPSVGYNFDVSHQCYPACEIQGAQGVFYTFIY